MSSTVPRSMPSTKNGAVSPRSPNADLAMSKHMANAARRMASNNSPPFEPRVKRRRPSTSSTITSSAVAAISSKLSDSTIKQAPDACRVPSLTS